MDCNTGLQLGRQLQKDAMMMHGSVHVDPAMVEQDMLMQHHQQQQQQAMLMGAAQGVAPHAMPGADWAHAFAAQQQHQQQQHVAAAVRQQHEMHALRQRQQMGSTGGATAVVAPALPAPVTAAAPMMMMGAASGMMMATAGMGMGMMLPRTQYQPTLNMQATQLSSTTQQQLPQQQSTAAAQDSAWATQLGQQQWAQDYSSAQTFTLDGQSDATVTEKTRASQFFAFMDRIRNKEVLIDEEKGEVVAGPGPDPEAPEDTEVLRTWIADEGIDMPADVFGPASLATQRPASVTAAPPHLQQQQQGQDVAAAVTAAVDTAMPGEEAMADDGMDMTEQGVEDWAKEYNEMQQRLSRVANNTDYPFEPNNPYVHHDNPMEEGMEMLQLSNLAEAALAFEAVCQRDGDNFEAWRVLGTTQAENEKDGLAIIALNNARRLRPGDVGVHAALCASHTNEHNVDAAMDALKAWLLHHPEYEQLANMTVPPDPDHDLDLTDNYYYVDPTRVREVSTLYRAALELNPRDAQLHSNLGVLFNLSHDYDVAATHFRHAVELRPGDATLWNKLGATLANGNHADQALDAYTHALDINPGYVRAMYNLAVAYSNLGRYPHAAKQVVRAIAAQQGNTRPTGEGSVIATREMWDLLRMTLSLMERNDLVQLTHTQDLAPFIKEFGLEGLV